ncbi:hypothetical protein CHS0354_031437 [Potamilus streckersoni]|uniref:Uncharacterized protein n=1 Tax=Potamilus streckersoni TaxID=2493646 RepID=A0AAE0SH77_9BIVA|nr:hypothetical protein CHS0354_031437 [Potamilus streckersoni]
MQSTSVPCRRKMLLLLRTLLRSAFASRNYENHKLREDTYGIIYPSIPEKLLPVSLASQENDSDIARKMKRNYFIIYLPARNVKLDEPVLSESKSSSLSCLSSISGEVIFFREEKPNQSRLDKRKNEAALFRNESLIMMD